MTSKTIFLNDQFLPYEKAFIHIEDRGFQFGDGIYEVILFENNQLIDFDNHIKRLFRSLNEINLKIEKTPQDLKGIFLKLFDENNLTSGSVYVQITRGTNPRNYNFPKNYQPTINAIVNPLNIISQNDPNKGFKAITHEDIRWKRCDIKSVALLANTMLKEKATNQDACEVILVRDNFVTEGSFSSVFIVNDRNQLITRQPDDYILKGVTRDRIIDLAQKSGIEVIENKFTIEEFFKVKEVFLTSSVLKIRPINQVNDKVIGNGKVGDITKQLMSLYANYCNGIF